MSDDLRQPLKKQTISDRLKKLQPSTLQAATGLVILLFAGGFAWTMSGPAIESGVSLNIKIHKLEKLVTASTPKQQPQEPVENSDPQDVEPDPQDLAADRELASSGQVTIIRQPTRRYNSPPLVKAPVRSVSERGRYGTIPKIARNGKRPFTVYAARTKNSVLQSSRPKIALIIGGMGINRRLTDLAISSLPGPVSFAFAPYGKSIQRSINKARSKGHEIYLHLPMEPYGYPGINPGPRTLLATAAPEKNLDNLQWFLSRFSGYAGVTNYMGAKFTSDGGALMPVFSRLKARGLVYLDDASNGANLTRNIAEAVSLPIRRANMVLDSNSEPISIQRQLSALESLARQNGLAIGSATGLETTIETINDWIKDLKSKGFDLVPVSAAYKTRRG